MKFNEDKFQHLPHGRNLRSARETPRGEYFSNDGSLIKVESNVRDLGIEISASSDFSVHINLTCKRARDKTAWIFRNFYSRDVQFLSFMWRIYVQPILDYGCQLWAPSRQLEKKQLEDVFKNFSARAQQNNKNSQKLHFWERLVQYNVKSQQRCHERFRIICVWKILENFSPNCALSWENLFKNGRLCSIPSSQYETPRSVKTLRETSFQVKGPALFNSLPMEIRNATNCSLNSFKNLLDSFLEKIPDTPLSQTYFPVPLDRLSASPSNSIIDWMRYLETPGRRGGGPKDHN